jgi:hypothetical protein
MNQIFPGMADLAERIRERIREMSRYFSYFFIIGLMCGACRNSIVVLTVVGTDNTTSSVTSVETDTGTPAEDQTDSDTREVIVIPNDCDGDDVDCYTECWGCASANVTCLPTLEDCLSDTRCAVYFTCLSDSCCSGGSDCVTGERWDDCKAGCAGAADATKDTLALYNNIDMCVACDVCAISCAQNESRDFAICATPEEMNTADNPCYAEDADTGEVACFSWANQVGPCTEFTNICMMDDDCQELDRCIIESWSDPDWALIQEECFAAAGSAAEENYWHWMQCVYCDACSVACAIDAGSKRCDEYEGK